MWDRQRRGSRRRELHGCKASRESDRHLFSGQPIVVGHDTCPSTSETVSAPIGGQASTVCFLGSIAESSPPGHQVASCEEAGLLALGRLRPRFERNLCPGFEEEFEAPRTDGFLAHKAEVVY